MTRTLTAAVALTAALGMAGLAHAQSSAGPSTQPSTMSPNTPSSTMTSPMTSQSGSPSTATMSTPGASTQSPQANAGQSMPASQSEIQQAQQELKSQGLYRGQVDGVMGPETQTALSKFQRQQGLPETAQLDQQTLSRLNGGSNPSSGATQPMSGQSTGTPQSMTPNYPAGSPQKPSTGYSR